MAGGTQLVTGVVEVVVSMQPMDATHLDGIAVIGTAVDMWDGNPIIYLLIIFSTQLLYNTLCSSINDSGLAETKQLQLQIPLGSTEICIYIYLFFM
jgi:hypothetical protein